MITTRFFLATVLTILIAPHAHAETGVTPTEITIGSSSSLTGAAAQYGVGMQAGENAFFGKLNANGGINGRKIVFKAKDDAYDPKLTTDMSNQLIEKEKIFAWVGGNGSPTLKVAMPIMQKAGVPLLFPYSGADFLRGPDTRLVYNTRVSYFDEQADLVDYIVNKLGKKDIGVLYQNDAFGESGREAVKKALAKYGLHIAQSANFSRDAVEDLDLAVANLVKAKLSVVFLEGISIPCANFVKKAAALGYHPIYAGPSSLVTFTMIDLLGKSDYQLYTSEVVPLATDGSIPLVKEYQQAMKAIGNEKFTAISLEGYIGAKVFAEAAKRAGQDLTRAKLISALDSMSDYDLGGVKVSFSPQKHQGLNEAFLMKTVNGAISQIRK